MVNGTPSGIERHRRTVLSSVVEMLPLSNSPTPIGMPTTIDPYCSWVGASRSILKRGHESKKSLEIYQHMGLEAVKGAYQLAAHGAEQSLDSAAWKKEERKWVQQNRL
jgi:hypothetical protein